MKQPQPTRTAILKATRALMVAGNFRPSAKEIARADGFSARSIHLHFPTLESLYMAAIDDATARAIVDLLPVSSNRELALAVVLGRVQP